MASFLRGKQAGIQNDLSAGILPGLFALDDLVRHGINSQISALAYDPVQSLLAVGTSESTFASGQIYVFGQSRVQVTFILGRRASIKTLQFCANRLVSLDSKNEITVWDLEKAKKLASYAPPGHVTSLVTDPMLDWALIGMQNGEVMAYDLDREKKAPFKLPNFLQEQNARAKYGLHPIVDMQLHPRDIGQLLIGYAEGAVIYSFKQNKLQKTFVYEVPPGAPGGGHADPTSTNTVRKPKLTHAMWHPTGTFIATAHDDGSLVFWDPKDGRVLMARTLEDTKVNMPGAPADPVLREPYFKIAWCCKENPDDTGVLVAGGQQGLAPTKGLTFLDLGITPVYATSSWQILSDQFQGKRQHIMPTPPAAEVIDFCLVPRKSPHFAGAQDPIAVIALLNSGELITLSFPTGHPISPTNQLPPSLAFVHPFVSSISVAAVDRTRWLGMTETRQQGPPILTGGAEAAKPLKRYETRNIVQTAHNDGTVRIFDAGQGDELENSSQLQVDVARALGRWENVDISAVSMAGVTGELAVGTKQGEVVIYRWGTNKLFGRESPSAVESRPGGLTNISERAEPSLKNGLQPHILYDMAQGPISALKISDVGFIAVGSENGVISIIDLRGPAVMFSASMSDFLKQEKRSSFLKSSKKDAAASTADWPTVIEFGVMTLDGDDYSSILCFVGTNQGRCATFKILPQGAGFTAKFAGATHLDGKVISINPMTVDTGASAHATQPAVAGLRNGEQVHGVLCVVTQTEARIFKPASSKGAQKSFPDIFCDAASVSVFEMHGVALVCIFGDSTARAYSIPALKEIGSSQLPALDITRSHNATVMPSGHIFAWTGPSEVAMLNAWGTGQNRVREIDKGDILWNQNLAIPPRPTISNLQWIAGTQYVSPTDLDILIGGPDRPPSKRMLEAAAEEHRLAKEGGLAGTGSSGKQAEGWGEYMTRQLNERTERLGIMGDSMERAEENSQGFLDDVNKFVGKQKRNILLGGLTKGFGF